MTAPHPQRRLADRLLDAGAATARKFVEADRYDPGRPALSVLIAETIAEHERIGEERILTRLRERVESFVTMSEQYLREAQEAIARGALREAASRLDLAAWCTEQATLLRSLSTPDRGVDGPAGSGEDQPA